MRYKKYETKYGSINYRQYGYPDLISGEWLEDIPKETIFKHINPTHVGGNVKKARERTARYLYRLLWECIVELVLAGNIVELPYGGKIYIGVIDRFSKKHANFNTDGRVYGIKLQLPKEHGYKLRMPLRRRIQLKENLDKGKHYFNF